MAECGRIVEGNTVSFSCDLELGHDGPHRAKENPRSKRERARWEEMRDRGELPVNQEPEPSEQPSGLEEFQGRAQTTAERYTMNPTDHPGVVREEPVEKPVEDVEKPEKADRPGDQELPTRRKGGSVQDRIISKLELLKQRTDDPEVIAELDELIEGTRISKRLGMERYGTELQTFNGRDTLKDAMDEARDLYIYLNSLHQARTAQHSELVAAVERAIEKERSESSTGLTIPDVAEIAVNAILDAVGPLDWWRELADE